MFRFAFFICILFATSSFVAAVTTANQGTVHAVSKSKYTRAHSLGNDYNFDARDGWEHVNVTNMQYKYTRSQPDSALEKRGDSEGPKLSTRHGKNSESKGKGGLGVGGTIKHVLGQAWNGLKAIGKPEPVIITWYTGHDLLNPSCWSNGAWHPTDASFAAALTLEGWTTRPKCFKFLELCNTPKKCVFVRVVDTCAGCAKGSKHVDLTKAAFGELASIDTGTLTVQLRLATEPNGWFEDLWGPKN